jgi:membrane protein YdbS with pleckstrin-like domain
MARKRGSNVSAVEPKSTIASRSADPARDDEVEVCVASEGQVVNVRVFVVCGVTFWLIVPLLYLLWRVLKTSRHQWVLTNQRLREFRGVLFRDVEELELYRVKDISIQQPPLQAMFGLGRLTLRTSDHSTPVVVLNAIPQPLALADLLRKYVERCRQAKGMRELDAPRSFPA